VIWLLQHQTKEVKLLIFQNQLSFWWTTGSNAAFREIVKTKNSWEFHEPHMEGSNSLLPLFLTIETILLMHHTVQHHFTRGIPFTLVFEWKNVKEEESFS
jgi:hypothetical protein